jgi:WD40 repeat protein
MATLQSFHRAREAEYRHGNRKGCLEGTRIAVLDEIELWAREPNRPPIYWLNGLAGTGKSTIAQTTAERMFADARLGGSFFCSRDSADRSNLQLIFPTLAVQLARRYPEFRSSLVPLVRSDPECATESLYNQMRKMIVGPLKASAISTVIMIDALDECRDEEPESAILSVIGQLAPEIPNVKFFLTGRPEPHILRGFNLPEMVEARDVFVLHEIGPSEVRGDIRRLFDHWFADIARRRRGLNGWPTTEQLDRLCERAAGLFVYAMATIKFVDGDSPRERLDLLLQSPESSAREGKIKLKTNTTLDSLYTSILQQAFGDNDPEDDPRVLSVLGAVVLTANPLSPSVIATLLSFDTEAVFFHLSLIHSLLVLQEDVDVPVLPFHKSFPDFITDPTRCTNKRFHVSPSDHHQELLVECLNLMDRRLEKNMCGLPDVVKNNEVDDLGERAYLCIDESLKYACESWHKHLVDEHTARAPEVASALHRLLEKKFLCWLEVLSVLGSTREGVDALKLALHLLEVRRVTRLTHFLNLPRLIQESPTLDLVTDCVQFMIHFDDIIRTSAPHIYHSALPLSPQTSIVRQLYISHARPLTRIVHGLPTSYPDTVVNALRPSIQTAVWSPCSKFIAVASRSEFQMTIEILDGATLERLTILKCRLGWTQRLIFSPDSRLLTWFVDSPEELISWDLRTGVQLSVIPLEPVSSIKECFSLTYSECGTMLGVVSSGDETPTISVYNVLSGTYRYSHRTGGVFGEIWTHDECVRYATLEPEFITIWEFGFASRHEPTQIESLSPPNDFSPLGLLAHPTLSRLAFINRIAVLVWDYRESRILLDFRGIRNSMMMSFSLDGHLFVCEREAGSLGLWKESPVGYVLHGEVQLRDKFFKDRFSPDGELIVGWDDSGVQVRRITDPTILISNTSTRAPTRTGMHMVEFSPGEVFAAITQLRDNVVTVLHLESGDPWLVIDTGVEVHGLRVGESVVVVVVGEGKIVTWDLPAGNCALNARASIEDSVRTTIFTQPPLGLFPQSFPIPISPDLRRMAIVDRVVSTDPIAPNLRLYNVSTGQCLAYLSIGVGVMPWLVLDKHKLWRVIHRHEAEGWSILEGSRSDAIMLEHIGVIVNRESSYGYEVMDGGWVFSSNGKRLLQSNYLLCDWMWSGQFVVLLHHNLPGPILLEFPAEWPTVNAPSLSRNPFPSSSVHRVSFKL